MRLSDIFPAALIGLCGVAFVAAMSLAPRTLAGPVGAIVPPWSDRHAAFRAAVAADVPVIDIRGAGHLAVFDLTGRPEAATLLRRMGFVLFDPRYGGTCVAGSDEALS